MTPAELKPYPRYKPSGVEWLGKAPAHWEVERLKSLARNVVEQTAGAGMQRAGFVVAMENVESWTGRIRRINSDSSFDSQLKRFRAGDVLFGKLRPYLAKVARLATDGLCVGEFLVLRPRCGNVMGAYVEHLLRSQPIIDAVNRSTFGARMPRADWQFIGRMPITRPPLPEQAAIARFLDRIDRRISRRIGAKEKLIALLEEYRQVLASDAVTGRFDVRTGKSYPAYKPSGIKWLGEVPAHWEVIPNRAIFSEVEDREHPQEQMLSVTISAGVVRQEELLKDPSKKDGSRIDKTEYKLVEPGDVAYNKMRAWQGAIGVSKYRGIISPAYVVQRPRVGAHPRYLHHLLRTPAFAKEAQRYSYGITSDMWGLRPEHFKMIYGCLPPLPEQTAIARFLDQKIGKIREGVAQAQGEIDLLREYRTKLIADVVTGKLDVREAAAKLPQFDPLAAADRTDDLPDACDAPASRSAVGSADVAG